jgi:hypothetical protein
MQILNKYEKEQLVIKLHQDGKTIRDIASTAHMSFSDIGKIIKRIDGYDDMGSNLSNKSKETKALWLFGKRPIDVSLELDLPFGQVEELQEVFWGAI